MTMVLLFDLAVPLGVSIGVLYIPPILFSLWFSHREFTLLITLVATFFTIFAFFWQPGVNDMWKVVFNRALALFAIWVTAILGLKRKTMELKREKAVREREEALKQVQILRGFLPICAACKKIRNDQGHWVQIEEYIRDHSEAEFSHSICPSCACKLYPEIYSPQE
ncbi:MAG: hypothetical protein ACOZF0_11420 [Thermodesulfobacteriota bacterium]